MLIVLSFSAVCSWGREGAGSLEELKVKKKHEEETKKASQPKPRQQQPKGFESTEAPASVATPKTSAHTAKSKAPSGSPIQVRAPLHY
jgi:uncharacterized lipoprotein